MAPHTFQPGNRPPEPSTSERRWGRVVFCLIVAALLIVRVPVMYREPGEMDEECYGVPGLFVLRDGIPRLPHIPGRAAESVFYHADTVIFAEPPLYFYVQALFFAVLPPVYGTARLATVCSGIFALGLVWTLTRSWFGSTLAAAWATGLLSMSRWFFLQVIRARPDILCTTFGLATLWAIVKWRAGHRLRWLMLAGVFIGLGGLTHPFALVYAVQVGVWVMIESRGWKRLLHPALVAAVAILMLGLWLPLILAYPEIFRVQFRNQFLTAHEPLSSRLLPWDALLFQGALLWHQVKPWQFLMAVVSLVICTVHAWRSGSSGARTVVVLAWSSIYLMLVLVGTHHLVPGYWTYPVSLMFICVGWLVQHVRSRLPTAGQRGAWTAWALGLALALSMIPQSRVGTLLVHLRHWDDIDYNAPRFARRMMSDIPADALCVVDLEFLLDFVAAGRPTVGASANPIFLQADQLPWQYFVSSRTSIDNGMVNTLHGRLLRTYGDLRNGYACYAALYQAAPAATLPDPPTEPPPSPR